jgi:hypothetical protein
MTESGCSKWSFSKVRDARNNEHHVCARAQDGERPLIFAAGSHAHDRMRPFKMTVQQGARREE